MFKFYIDCFVGVFAVALILRTILPPEFGWHFADLNEGYKILAYAILTIAYIILRLTKRI